MIKKRKLNNREIAGKKILKIPREIERKRERKREKKREKKGKGTNKRINNNFVKLRTCRFRFVRSPPRARKIAGGKKRPA